MRIPIQYGKEGLEIEIPDSVRPDVISPEFEPAAAQPEAVLRSALQSPIGGAPLRDIVFPGSTVGVVVNDITRATPYKVILPVLLDEIDTRSPKEVIIFVATGTHRTNTDQELEATLGAEALRSCRIVQNDAREEASHVSVGRTASGNDIRILRSFVDCDVKVLTGFIEPHFFAGFSGGGKAVMPGLASLNTVMRNHSVANIDHPSATWGVTWGNPIWEEAREAASFADPDFLLNVALNRDKKITHVFAGDFFQAHEAGCTAVHTTAMAPVDAAYDLVVTSNSGFPLDLNLYQSVKGMSAAAQIVKTGGHIICAAECWDGVPEHGSFGRLLEQAESPPALLATMREPGYSVQDMWQAQILALICENAQVHMYSDGLSDEQIRHAMLTPCADIARTVAKIAAESGSGFRCCILPEGPVTIPYVKR